MSHLRNNTESDPPATALRLWHASASTSEPGIVESCCERWMTTEERIRADRFRQPTSRNQHVVGRGMARRLLSDGRGCPSDVQFEFLPHGKPIAKAPDRAKRPFNVAHTDGLVVCGMSMRTNDWIGVDVEHAGRRTDIALADRYFAAPEIAFLKRVGGDASRRRTFLRIWTLKESFIKAIGTGMHTPLADFAFIDIDSEAPQIEMLNPKLEGSRHWKFWCLEPRPDFLTAVAIAAEDDTGAPEIKLHCFDELVRKEAEG